MSRAWLAVLAVLAAPGVASACTWCVSSAFGDRSFNWPYLGLIVAPFLVGVAVAGVFVHHTVGFRELGRLLRHGGPSKGPPSPPALRAPGNPERSAGAEVPAVQHGRESSNDR